MYGINSMDSYRNRYVLEIQILKCCRGWDREKYNRK
jgi:hypothetical protein